MEVKNIPPTTCIQNALRIYYSFAEIGNAEITSLFGKLSPTTISRLKKLVYDEMYDQGILSHNAKRVHTQTAFEVWGIDVADLENRHQKLRDLGFVS